MSTKAAKRTTIYLDSSVHQALRMKAAQTSHTVSDLVNDAVRLSLREDAIDLQAIKDRAHEPALSYETVLRNLKRDGLL